MTDPNSVSLSLTCSCGEKYKIGVAGLDLESIKFTCPGCGVVDSLTPDQISAIKSKHEAVVNRLKVAFKEL
ncbi:hypothetical protein FB480_103409 [Agrobacterium vitis]|nr:hypothetical protein FB480_103409 [Agrobacterium vitis]